MSIESVRVTFERTGELDERMVRTYQVVARVRTSTADDGPGTVMDAILELGLQIGTPYQEPNGFIDVGARCRRIAPKPQDDNPRVWLVDVTFSSAPPERTATGERGAYVPANTNQGPAGQHSSGYDQRTKAPENRPPEFRIAFERHRVPVRRADRIRTDNGAVAEIDVPVATSAGFPVDPLPERDENRTVITIARNEVFDSAEELCMLVSENGWQDVVNEDVFLGYAAGMCKLCVESATLMFEDDIVYWRVTYRIDVRTKSPTPLSTDSAPLWDEDILDAGYHYIASNKAVRITDRDGAPVNEPWPLDGLGGKVTDPSTYTPTYRRWRFYRRRPFADLNFGL